MIPNEDTHQMRMKTPMILKGLRIKTPMICKGLNTNEDTHDLKGRSDRRHP